MSDDSVKGAPVTIKEKKEGAVAAQNPADIPAAPVEKSMTATVSDTASAAAAKVQETAQSAAETAKQTAIDAKNKANEVYQSTSAPAVVEGVKERGTAALEGAKEMGASTIDSVKSTAQWAKDKVVAGYEAVKHAAESGISGTGSTYDEELRANAEIDGGETGKKVLDQTSAPDAEAAMKTVMVAPDAPPSPEDKKPKKSKL